MAIANSTSADSTVVVYGGDGPPRKLIAALNVGMLLGRGETQHLLKRLETIESSLPGCDIIKAQLRGVLERKDWSVISITANPETMGATGVSIGIAQATQAKRKSRLTPLQKWQRAKGLIKGR